MDAFRDQNPNPVLPFAIRHPIEAVSRLTRADACVQEVFRSVAPDRVDAIDDDDSKDEFDALEVFGTAQLRPNLSSAIAQLRPLLPSAPHLSAKRPNPKEGDPRKATRCTSARLRIRTISVRFLAPSQGLSAHSRTGVTRPGALSVVQT